MGARFLGLPWQKAILGDGHIFSGYDEGTESFTLRVQPTTNNKTTHYIYQEHNDNFTAQGCIQNLTSNDSETKAGLMLRQDNTDSSKYVYIGLMSTGTEVKYVDDTDTVQTVQGQQGSTSMCYKLEREENSVRVYERDTDLKWTLVATIALSLVDPVNIGLAVGASEHEVQAIVDDVVVEAQGPPSEIEAVFSATPLSGDTPLEVTFDASQSVGSNLSYEWNFGDDTTATGQNVTHSYSTPGVYLVTLTVSDGINNSTTKKNVFAESPKVNGFYTLETPGYITGVDGITIGAKIGSVPSGTRLTIVKDDSVLEEEEHPIYDTAAILRDMGVDWRDWVATSTYTLNTPDLTIKKENHALNSFWIGIPIPEGVNGRVVEMYILSPTDDYDSSGKSIPHWNFRKGYFHAESNVYYAPFGINQLLPEETISFVLLDFDLIEPSVPTIDELPWLVAPHLQLQSGDAQSISTQSHNSSFEIKCERAFEVRELIGQENTCEKFKHDFQSYFDEALMTFKDEQVNFLDPLLLSAQDQNRDCIVGSEACLVNTRITHPFRSTLQTKYFSYASVKMCAVVTYSFRR